ncbi:uncharacterized protein LOC111882529 isoform X2 [Lactuca sativa]|uniref:uncharacterized protein LOC111882529 isoform X2 n=1 Tax=Lactuca sativa TaxID=4236 RepID=UPI000CD9A0DC|nr:uncharacterized protein LOC111882529 isoform X2 [Lactuca sativa]
MAGKGKGTAADYLSGKRTRDGGPKTVFRSDYLFSSRDVEDSRNGVFLKNYFGQDLGAQAGPKAPGIPVFPKNEERYEENQDKFLEEHYKHFRSKYGGVSVGSWARVKRGKYMGDLAQVVNVNEFQRKATVKLLPRIDLQAMAIKYSGGDTGYQYTSPAPRLITSSELKLRVRHSLDPETGDLYEVFDGMKLKDGYVFKKLSLDSLNFSSKPSEAELKKFSPGKEQEESNDLNKKQTTNNNQVPEGLSSSDMENTFEIPDLVNLGGKAFGRENDASEARFVEKLRSGAKELSDLMEEAATRCLGRASVENQLRCAIEELQSCKERVSAAEAERDTLRDRLKLDRKKILAIFRRILDTNFDLFPRLKEDVRIWCANI